MNVQGIELPLAAETSRARFFRLGKHTDFFE